MILRQIKKGEFASMCQTLCNQLGEALESHQVNPDLQKGEFEIHLHPRASKYAYMAIAWQGFEVVKEQKVA